jgi:hypothetical protein
VILKLGADGSFYGPVAGIVYAGSHLVGHQAPVGQFKKFKGQGSYVVKGGEQAVHELTGKLGRALGVSEVGGGGHTSPQDAALVVVVGKGIVHHFTGPTPGGNLGDFPDKFNEAFDHAGGSGNGRPAGGQIRFTPEDDLSLAVVAESSCLQYGGKAEDPGSPMEVLEMVHSVEGCRGDSLLLKPLFFQKAILGCGEGKDSRKDASFPMGAEMADGRDGCIFGFVGEEIQPTAEHVEDSRILEGAGQQGPGGVSYRTAGGSIKEPQGNRTGQFRLQFVESLSQHEAELATSQDTKLERPSPPGF